MEEWKRDVDEQVQALSEGQEKIRDIVRLAKGAEPRVAKRKRTDQPGQPAPAGEAGRPDAAPPSARSPAAAR